MKNTLIVSIAALTVMSFSTMLLAESPKYKADVPASITTPDRVSTSYAGELKFVDGFPTEETVSQTYDFLDTARATMVFTNTIGIGSMQAMLEGQKKAGIGPYEIAVFENLLDARSLWLTPNTTTPYAVGEIDTKNGPVVVDNPGPVLGIVDDAFFTHVTDIGFTGPDKGKGGKYLFVSPDYKGEIPEGYIVIPTRGYRHWLIMRLIVKNGDIKKAVTDFKAGFHMYPLAKAGNPPKQVFLNFSGKKYNTIHSNDESFFDEINASVQYEPTGVFSPEINGQMASIGIKKGKEFKPDARMQKILVEGAALGNASARAILFSPRNKNVFFYPGKRQWYSPLAGGSHEFMDNGELVQDDRTMMLYFATGITPSMVLPKVGTGSVYEIAARDSEGNYLDGGKHYTVTLPGPVPINNFWSFMINDAQTRSILETDQKSGGIDSNRAGLAQNADGSVTVYFGPTPPKGHEKNWAQTMPGKGYTVLLRLYGPLQPWYDKSWMPGDLELVKLSAQGSILASESDGIIVTRDNFTKAETIRNANNYIKLGGDNKWTHFRKIAPIGKKAPTVRMNLDTLYSVAVLDNPNGKITVTIPEGDVLRTILVLDEEAYSLYYFQEAGEHEIVSKSPFILLIARLGVKDYQNTKDIEYAHKLQDGLKVRGQGTKSFNPAKYDKASLGKLTKELKKEFLSVGKGIVVQGQFKDDVDEYKRLMTTAAAFGGMHDQINTYNNSPMMDPEKCYVANFIDPKVRDFFSFTMYDEDGYLIEGKTAENSYNMKANDDGSYTVHFNCGEDAINNLDSGGLDYNYMVRTYGASDMVKSGQWNPVKDTVIIEQ